ncbi:MAG TPA: hypothetical protein VK756_07690 [Solirubrobacteraceae bacterium]|jgi:hypothetical protein|nr:hypothetical protein [Solirubrobacteraceae bacterium]
MSRHPGYAADIAEDANGNVIHLAVHRVERGKPAVVIHRQRWQPTDRKPVADILAIAEQAADDDRADILATATRRTLKVRAPQTTEATFTATIPPPARPPRRPATPPVPPAVATPDREPDRQGRRPQASKRRHGRPSRTPAR